MCNREATDILTHMQDDGYDKRVLPTKTVQNATTVHLGITLKRIVSLVR